MLYNNALDAGNSDAAADGRRCLMTVHSTGTIALAEGHTIESAVVYKKRRLLDDLPIKTVLRQAEVVASVDAFTELLDGSRFGGMAISDAYHAATARKDWMAVDQLVLDTLARNRAVYAKVLDAEAWMYAFNERLCAETGTARAAFRWIDPPELQIYLSGVFESRMKDNRTRRGFKALSMNPSLKFLGRKVKMTIPLNLDMRRCVKCVRYTTLPRQVRVEDERIADGMAAANVNEAEIRVPDGTAVPAETIFTVQHDALVDKRVVSMLKEMYTVRY